MLSYVMRCVTGVKHTSVVSDVIIVRRVFLSQDLENQALTEAEAWREQQAQLQEQQAVQNRVKREVEAEAERYKQVK